MSNSARVCVGPDRKLVTLTLAIYGLGLLIILVFATGLVVIGDSRDEYSLAWIWLGGGSLWAIVLLIPTAYWWWNPGRTRYEVADGYLMVWRGQKILHRWPCSEIYGLWVRGGVSWPQLLNPKVDTADGKFPHLVVWTDRKTHAPAILRAGWSARHEIETELINAYHANGTEARLSGS